MRLLQPAYPGLALLTRNVVLAASIVMLLAARLVYWINTRTALVAYGVLGFGGQRTTSCLRQEVCRVARDALAADPASSLNSIARTASVGAGTLYRHFPSRESLVLGVYRKEIDTLVALAPVLLSKHPPLHAFRTWCDRLAKFGRMKYGVADIVHAGTSDQDMQETYGPMLGAVRQLMDACEGSGEIRPGTNPEDFLVLVGLLWRILQVQPEKRA